MGAHEHDAALAVVKATSVPIHDIGTAAYLSPDIAGWAAEWGWSNPFAFYFAGRGGMLGDVGADVVTSAFGWFEPNTVHAMFSEGVGVAGASGRGGAHGGGAREVGREALRRRGRDRGDRRRHRGTRRRARRDRPFPLFVGWRNATRAESAAGQAAQLMQILREWRGGVHLVATTAVGLSPLGGHPDQ